MNEFHYVSPHRSCISECILASSAELSSIVFHIKHARAPTRRWPAALFLLAVVAGEARDWTKLFELLYVLQKAFLVRQRPMVGSVTTQIRFWSILMFVQFAKLLVTENALTIWIVIVHLQLKTLAKWNLIC